MFVTEAQQRIVDRSEELLKEKLIGSTQVNP